MSERFIIGHSDPEGLLNAVREDLDRGVKPGVIETQREGVVKYEILNRYVGLYLQECIKRSGIGQIDFPGEIGKISAYYTENSSNNSNNCMGICIRSTESAVQFTSMGKYTYRKYHFMKGKSKDCLLFLKVITEDRQWLIPYDIVNQHYTKKAVVILNTANDMARWAPYEVTKDNVANRLHEYYTKMHDFGLKLMNIDEIKIPLSAAHQVEVFYRRRLDVIKPYTFPMVAKLKYDLILDGIKIQEKVINLAQVRTHIEVTIKISPNYPYKIGDFDSLLAHLPDPYGDSFYFIPARKLVEMGIMKTDSQKGKLSFQVFPPNIKPNPYIKSKTWSNEFLFKYNDTNIRQKLIDVYKKYAL